ncbi:MAG: D-alanyl-D-alanine carboxypeptidase family protein [Halanaerobiales bacterium]
MLKKQFLLSIIISVILLGTFAVNTQALEIEAPSAILMEAETGQVLYEKNPDEKRPPASITKIMTMLLVMEYAEKGEVDFDEEVTISEYAASMGGSQIYLGANDKLTIEELMEAVTIASANDASVALAETIGGSYNNFIEMMNEKASELGMDNTKFVNSTGLPAADEEHYSTAYDIAIMSREIVEYEKVLEWATIWMDHLNLGDRKAMLVNTNKLINNYPDLDGLKTGHTQSAGFCLAATARRDDMRLISVILGADTEKQKDEETAKLLNYGFNSFNKEVIIEEGEKVDDINIPNGEKRFVSGYIDEDLKVALQRGEEDELEIETKIKDDISAPISKGDVVGQRIVKLDGEELGMVNIVAEEDVKKASIFVRLWRSFVNWIGSFLENK